MKNIFLTEIEVNELVDIYEAEIDRSQRRINNLQSLIIKLKESSKASEAKVVRSEVKEAASKEKEPVVKTKVAKTKVARAKVSKSKVAKAKIAKAVVEQPAEVVAKAKPVKRVAKKKIAKKAGKANLSKYKAIKSGKGETKVKWADTIMNIMKDINRPMLSSEIATEAIMRLKIEEDNRARAKSAIATNITKLLKSNAVVKQPVAGQKGSLFVLPEKQ